MTSGSTLTNLFDKISFTSKLPTLMKATSDDSVATPGYLFEEICKMSRESSNACQYLLDFFLDRLMKSSYHIKLKVLRLIRHLLLNGNKEFLNNLRKRSDNVRKMTNFSGSPDPLHGNAPYEQVRQLANENIRILFDVSDSEKRIKDVNKSRDSPSNLDVRGHSADSLADKPKREELAPVQKFYSPVTTDRIAGKPGGGWDNDETKIDLIKKGDSSRIFSTPSQSSNLHKEKPSDLQIFDTGTSHPRTEVNATTSDEINYEKALVDDITVPVGIRSAPSTAVLDNFMKRCYYLNHRKILLHLCEKLKEPINIQQKALTVIERALKQSNFWSNDDREILLSQIKPLLSSNNAVLRNRVSKIMYLIEDRHEKVIEEIQSLAMSEARSETNVDNSTASLLSEAPIEISDTVAKNNLIASLLLEPPTETFDNVTKDTSSGLFNGMFLSASANSNDSTIPSNKDIPLQSTNSNPEKSIEQLIHFGSMESANQEVSSVQTSLSNSKTPLEQLVQFGSTDVSVNSDDKLILSKNYNKNDYSTPFGSTVTTLSDSSVKQFINFDLTGQTAKKGDNDLDMLLNKTSNDGCVNDIQLLSQWDNGAEKSDKGQATKFPTAQLEALNSNPLPVESFMTKAVASNNSQANTKDSKRSFHFLNKSTKGNAFNFVSETMQAEMKGRKT